MDPKLTVLILMLMGGVGCASAFYYPHTLRFSSDHAIGSGVAGVIWLVGCFLLSLAIK